MLRIRNTLSLSALTLILAACPSPEGDPVELKEGNWSFTFEDVTMVGECDEFEPVDGEDRPLRGKLFIDGEEAAFEAEGMIMEGSYIDNLLDVEAGVGFGENPHEDTGGDTGDGEDVMTLRLKATAESSILVEGELSVAYHIPGMECTITASTIGRHMGEPNDDGGED